MAVTWKKFAYFTDIPTFASAAEDLAGAEAAKAIAPLTNPQLIKNLKLVVNASVNKLDIFTKSGGAVPDATNIISVAIPDGNGFTFRSRAAAYLSGTSQFIMADAAGYWGRGSENTTMRDAYVYAIWDVNGGIVWALGGHSGFIRATPTTTLTHADFLLLEASSTYTKTSTDYCVCVGRIRYEYDTNDAPDYSIKTISYAAPQVGWNLYPVVSPQTTGFTLEGGLLNPKTLTVTADTSLDEAVAMSSKAPKASPSFTAGIGIGGVAAGTGGIAFPATAVAVADVNTLDDYEEGTWTPTFTGQGGSASFSGIYRKIGDTCFVGANLAQIASTAGAGAVTIGGLPFPGGGASGCFAFGYIYQVDWPSTAKQLTARNYTAESFIRLEWSQDNAAVLLCTGTDFDHASAQIILFGFYRI